MYLKCLVGWNQRPMLIMMFIETKAKGYYKVFNSLYGYAKI